ncbi:efflux RND transporter periplasmic adaptor subunit [Novosphingobium terrae]|uniref:efflux RND transporter periplasmic adaptor subunit n=1 Tax=Novosphingobium terrae TaxID=2726189 RepID=UPI0019816E92|nr:efflux RND transporter periplasmic adaptor subunit [Novosphingobium terrae]
MSRLLLLPLGCLMLAGCGSSASTNDPAPSVLVTTQPAQQGTAPTMLAAYGSARPSTDGAQTMSSAQPGQVTAIAVTPGAAVHAGQTLLTFTLAPTARTTYEQAAHALAAAQKQRASTAQLFSQQLATRDQLVQAEKAVSDAQIALDGLAREGAGQSVKTFTAPFDGIVTAITVAQGDRTAADAPLITVARTRDIVITVGVQPEDRAKVRAGQEAHLQRLSGGETITGHVLRVASALNVKTRMMDADIAIPANALLPGEGLRADIHTGDVQGWLVPHKAVVTANGPAHVFQLEGGKAKAVEVQLLQSSSAGDVVQGPLNPHAPLIVDGAFQVDDGAAVRTGR